VSANTAACIFTARTPMASKHSGPSKIAAGKNPKRIQMK